MTQFIRILTIVFSFSLLADLSLAKIYKVKDHEGRVIYTDIPYSEFEEVKVKVKKVSSSEVKKAQADAANLDASSKSKTKELISNMMKPNPEEKKPMNKKNGEK